MLTISVPDSLRMSVEAASGGRQTVLYTAKGQPTYMNIIPQIDGPSLDGTLPAGPHPAFIVGGEVKSSIMIGTYPGVIRNGELLSLPGVDPTTSQPYTSFVGAASACGAGFHVMTNAEWAAVALLTAKSGPQPRGNTNWGRAHNAAWETARRADNGTPGSASGVGRTLTGSGPVSWRHDGTPAGIADLVGNIWEFTPGLRLVDGEIQILANNDAATASLFDDSAPWKAILQDGSLVAPGTAGTLKLNSPSASNNDTIAVSLGAPTIATSVTNYTGPAGDSNHSYDHCFTSFASLSAATGVTVPAIMRALALAPLSSPALAGGFWMRNNGQRYPSRGGRWASGANAGLGALLLNDPASNADSGNGARPAFVL